MKLSLEIVMAGALLCSPGVVQVSQAITGCTNQYLLGTYNAQVSNSSLMGVLNSLNGSAAGASAKPHDAGGLFGGPTGFGTGTGGAASSGFFGGASGFGSGTIATQGATTGSTSGGTTGGTTGAATGSTPAGSNFFPTLGRFYFDGSGNIVGVSPGNLNTVIGSYSINADCTASMKLVSGQTFDLVVAQTGSHALFLESDSGGAGAVGSLDRSATACIDPGSQQSFAFSYFGAQVTSASAFVPSGAVGTLSLDGQGGFVLNEWVYANGSVQRAAVGGTYSIGGDCALVLTFAPSGAATTGAVASLPASLRGQFVSGSTGLIIVQTDQNPADMVPGTFIAQ
jgi:hypothetical protein